MKPRHIKNRVREIEIEEIFLDKHLKEKDRATEVSDRKLEVPLKKINFVLLFLFGVIVIGMLLIGTFKLQVAAHGEYELSAQQNRFIISHLTSERGIIYDRNMEQLVWNEVSFDLWEDDVLKKKNLTHQELILFETSKEKPESAYLKKRILRHYKEGAGLSHVLGYLGKISSQEFKEHEDYEINDYIGREGLERASEEVLRERKGVVQIERTAEGKEISREIVNYPQSGDSLVLSLNLALQKRVVQALSQVLEEVESEKGVVVALNPQNGEVLASVSLPGFNNNLFSQGISAEELQKLNQDPTNPQLNRAIGGLYPTGSTIKPFIALASLEEGIIKESTQLYCPETLCIPHKYTGEGECFPDWKFHGWTDVKKAIAESVNPFFYIIGGGYQAPPRSSEFFDDRLPRKFEGLGLERIARYLQLFGLGEKTEVDLPGEMPGKVPDPAKVENWYLGHTYHLSIGQGYLLATPMQVAVAFGAIAADGKLFKPTFVKDNTILQKEGFVSQGTLHIVQQGMRQAVSSPVGSAYSLNFLPVAAAAKTGTAQIYPKKEIYHNWVAVFAPYENPEIVLVVLIEHVEGTRIAAQKVAKEVLQWYFTK